SGLCQKPVQPRRIGAGNYVFGRTRTGPIDMAGQCHQAAGNQVVANSTGRVGNQKNAGTQIASNQRRVNNSCPGMAFVIMQAAFENQNALAGPVTQEQTPRVSGYAGLQKSWSIGKGQVAGLLQPPDQFVQP